MGNTHLLFLPVFPSALSNLALNPAIPSSNPKFSSDFRCSSSSRRNWGSNSDSFRAGRFGFDEEFGSGRTTKRRNWWSDDDDDDDDEEDDAEFGFWGEPASIDWIFKVFRAFGWMVPALLVPILMGKEENSWIMALVLPLGQTALSLVMDKLLGDPSSNLVPHSRPRPRSKLRPRARSRTKSRPRSERSPFDRYANEKPRESRRGSPSMRGSYQSWEAADSISSASERRKGGSSFGGWDE